MVRYMLIPHFDFDLARVPAPPVDDPPLTPLYDSLTANLPHPVMAYTSLSFPPSTYLFPHAHVVEKYLESYADHFDLNSHIRLDTQVLSIEYIGTSWKVLVSGKSEALDFDLVIVCNGHYTKPRYPSTPGLQVWLQHDRASHSAWYRSPEKYKNLAVLVVGAGPSGRDISSEVRSTVSRVIHSITGGSNSHDGNLTVKGRIARFGASGDVEFEDGLIETGIDHCILATGYEKSFPFLPESLLLRGDPMPTEDGIPGLLYNSTYCLYPLARHIFPLFQTQYPPNSLAFIGLQSRVAPLPLVEAQAHAIVHFFANSDSFDIPHEKKLLLERYNRLAAELGTRDASVIWKSWHKFTDMEQFGYRDELYRFASSSSDPSTPPIIVRDWEREAYARRDSLRELWVELERSGKADDFVRGVGENGIQEWVDLMRKMMRMIDEKGLEDTVDALRGLQL